MRKKAIWAAVLLLLLVAYVFGVASQRYALFPLKRGYLAMLGFGGETPKAAGDLARAGLESDYSYDFENDPIGAAFYGRVPPFLDNIFDRYVRFREYSTDMFPLPPDQYAVFQKKIIDALVQSMTGPDGKGESWVVRNPAGKRSQVLNRFTVKPIDVVEVEGRQIELSTITVHDTGDVIPVAACFPDRTPAPGVVLFSGHTHYGLRELFIDRQSYQRAMALRLCEAGFATAALEKIDSGIVSEIFQQRGEKWRADDWADDEFQAATFLLGVGDYLIPGRQLMANIALTEMFAADPRVDHERMGAAGISLGGWLTLQTALVNDRIKVVANYGGMWAYVDHLLEDRVYENFEGINDYSQLSIGLWRLGDQNRFFLAAAPLVMLWGYGRADAPYTEYVDYFHPVIEKQYAAIGATENLEVHIHEDGHVMPAEVVTDFLRRRLLD